MAARASPGSEHGIRHARRQPSFGIAAVRELAAPPRRQKSSRAGVCAWVQHEVRISPFRLCADIPRTQARKPRRYYSVGRLAAACSTMFTIARAPPSPATPSEKLLRRLAASPDVGEITVLAHSMGAWLTMESLRQLAIRDGRLPVKIQNVILASPDLDVDVFRAQLKSFGAKRPSLVVFLSRQDRALALSRGIAGNIERLGAVDPSEQPWIDEKGVEVVDLSDAPGGDPLRHSKFAQNPDVVRFLGEELINGASGRPASGSRRAGRRDFDGRRARRRRRRRARDQRPDCDRRP